MKWKLGRYPCPAIHCVLTRIGLPKISVLHCDLYSNSGQLFFGFLLHHNNKALDIPSTTAATQN